MFPMWQGIQRPRQRQESKMFHFSPSEHIILLIGSNGGDWDEKEKRSGDKDRHYLEDGRSAHFHPSWLTDCFNAALSGMPSHAFPQKSVYQGCLSAATDMTSNHKRAGTSYTSGTSRHPEERREAQQTHCHHNAIYSPSETPNRKWITFRV